MTWLLNRGDPCRHPQGHGTDPVTDAEPGVGLTGSGEPGRGSPTVAATWTLLSVLCAVPRGRTLGPSQPAHLCFASDGARLALSSPFLIGARGRDITEGSLSASSAASRVCSEAHQSVGMALSDA